MKTKTTIIKGASVSPSHRFHPARALACLFALFAAPCAVGATLYGVSFSGPTDLYTVNQSTGQLTSVGPTGFDNIGDLTSDTRAGTERLWGIRIPSNELVEFNPMTGAGTVVSTLNSPDRMVSIAFDPVGGKLYGNTSIGFGAAFDALYEIDPASGNTTFIGRILFENVYALGFDQAGNLFGVSDATDDLISIDTTSGNGSFIADLATSFSFDIASRPGDNSMFLADSGTSSLYTVDTGTGALTPAGAYGSFTNVVGLAFLPDSKGVPEGGATVAMFGLGLAGVTALRRRLGRA